MPENLRQRRIDLDPRDWYWATWRNLPPLPRPKPAPFAPKEAAARLARVTPEQRGYVRWWAWEKAEISAGLSPEEAEFWLHAMARVQGGQAPAAAANELSGGLFAGTLAVEAAFQAVASLERRPDAWVMLPLGCLFPPETVLEELLRRERLCEAGGATRVHNGRWASLIQLVNGFRRYVVPYLTPEQRAVLRARVQPLLDFNRWPAWPEAFQQVPPLAFHLAAQLGLSEPLRALVESWPDGHYQDGSRNYAHRPAEILFGLAGAEQVAHHVRRLKVPLWEPDYICAWIAHTEWRALDLPRDAVVKRDDREDAEWMLAPLTRVYAPETAAVMLDLLLGFRAARTARRWLEANPEDSIPGLVPLAGARGRAGDAALALLRTFARQGHAAAIIAALEAQPRPVVDRVRETVLAAADEHAPMFGAETVSPWPPEAQQDLQPLRLDWAGVEVLPCLIVAGRRLNNEQVELALAALRSSSPEAAHPLAAALKAGTEPEALSRFVWELFERWLWEGAPPKEKWVLAALGLWGNDQTALKLAPLVRAWPGESQHARAVLGLECLRAIGTDMALLQIQGIAERVKFKGLKQKAGECIAAIAKERGMSRAELEDRIVPTLDLDERGTRVFDFGPRQFRLVLGPDLKPLVRDAEGKTRTDLPKPGAKDDALLAKQAAAEWKLLKKQLSEVVKIQASRLEQAMVTSRSWSQPEFETLLVRHPLMGCVARLLVWGALDGDGNVVATFRVTEDQAYADAADEPFALAPHSRVRIIHPLHLSEADRKSWAELLSDYELVPPFPQLGRPLHLLNPAEREQEECRRFAGMKIPAAALVGALERQGWERGIPADGGVFHQHSRPFPGAGVTAIVEYRPGVAVGLIHEWDDQEISRAYFVPGLRKPEWYPQYHNLLHLGKVDPVAVSEVLGDLELVATKGK